MTARTPEGSTPAAAAATPAPAPINDGSQVAHETPAMAPGADGLEDGPVAAPTPGGPDYRNENGQTDVVEWIVSSCTGFFTGDEETITKFGEDPVGWCQSNLPPECGPQDISRCMPEILDRCHQQGGDSESATHLAQYCGTFSQNSSSTYSSHGESSSSGESSHGGSSYGGSSQTTYSSGSHCACDTVVNEICYTVNVYHQTNIYVQVDETTTSTTGCFGDRTPCTTTKVDEDFGCEYPVEIPTWDPQTPSTDTWGDPHEESPPTHDTGHDTPPVGTHPGETPDDFPVHGGPGETPDNFPVHGGSGELPEELPVDADPRSGPGHDVDVTGGTPNGEPGHGGPPGVGTGEEIAKELPVDADPRFGTGFDLDVTAPTGAAPAPTADFGAGAGADAGPGVYEASPAPNDSSAPDSSSTPAAVDEPVEAAPDEPPSTPVFEAQSEAAEYEPAEPEADPTTDAP